MKSRDSKRAVCVVLRNREGKILSVDRPGRPGVLGLPGGMVDSKETLASAIGRELAEETGLLLIQERPVFAYHDGPTHVQCFTGKFLGTPMPMEGNAVRWVPPAALVSRSPFGAQNAQLFHSMRRQGYL